LLAKSDKLKESGETHDCTNFKFKIVLRKRPLLHKEVKEGELDCISNSETELRMHECKVKVDGITKYVQNSDFIADRVFGHTISTENIYRQLF
jgi:kinesin family protein 2/24